MTSPQHAAILVVDDDRNLTQALTLFLEYLGHKPVVCHQIQEAKHAVEEQVHDFLYAFVDHQMGEESGIEMVAWLLDRVPRIGIVIMSGFPFDSADLPEMQNDRVIFLQKPFRPADLAASLRQLRL